MVSYSEKIEAKTFKPVKPNKVGKPNKPNKPNKPKKTDKPVKPGKSLAQDPNAVADEQKKQEALDNKINEKASPNFIKLKQYIPLLYKGLSSLDLTKPKITKEWGLFFKIHGAPMFVRILRDLGIIKNSDVKADDKIFNKQDSWSLILMKTPIRPELTREQQLEEALANVLFLLTSEALTEHRIWNGKEWKADLGYERECLKLIRSKKYKSVIKKQIDAIENGYIGRVDVSPFHIAIIENAVSADGLPMSTIWFDLKGTEIEVASEEESKEE